jgi:hypothetical protein
MMKDEGQTAQDDDRLIENSRQVFCYVYEKREQYERRWREKYQKE